jgi:hypothetical protein
MFNTFIIGDKAMSVAESKVSIANKHTVGVIRPNTKLFSGYPDIGGLHGTCPRCNSGKLEKSDQGKYVKTRYGKHVELVNRHFYRCNNPSCGYENVAVVISMP